MDEGLTEMLEAHVRFELDHWHGPALGETVAEQVAVVFDRLDEVTLGGFVPLAEAQGLARRVVIDEPLPEECFEDIGRAVRAGYDVSVQESEPISDLVPRECYEQVVSAVVGLRRLREEVIAQATQSDVYTQLISHVLYHGLKDFMLTDNAVVRRVPGASSLLRLGQNAVRSATPHLEAGIDRRLVGFVATNVAGTVRDSRDFLGAILDDATMRTVGEEIWAVNASRTLGEVTEIVEEGSVDDLVAAGRDAWLAVRSSGMVARVVDAVVEQFYRDHDEESVSDVLARLGLTRGRIGQLVADLAARWVAVADEDGQLEASLRRRLEAFYLAYAAGPDARPA